jgi:hypothetical protein
MSFAAELAAAGERLYDFCLWEYAPAAPVEGKLRSINLLRASFADRGIEAPAMRVMQALRKGLGDSRTVWGIKQQGPAISWELYFYDYDRLERERSVARVLDLLAPHVPCQVRVSDRHPYFMFSLDLGEAQLARGEPLEEVQMYVGNIGSRVSSGICYGVSRAGMELRNFYFFFDAKVEMESVIGKVTSSAYLDVPRLDLRSILWPELVDCQTIVVANKRDRDGVYFCRINVGQLLLFLKRMSFPAAQVRYVEENRGRLDHMLYDVGFDYRAENGTLQIVKSAWYGVF